MSGRRLGQVAKSSLPLTLALRYLKSGRKDSFVTFLSAVAAGGMALGVGALILALSALAGFQSALRSEILRRTPAIEVEAGNRQRAEEARTALLGYSEVKSAQLTASGSGWVAYQGSVRAVELVGFENDLPKIFPRPGRRENGLYLPASLAQRWLVEPGDVVEVASGRPTLTPFGPQPRVVRLRLVDTFEAGDTEQRDRVALPLAAVEGLLGRSSFRVLAEIDDLERAAEIATSLRSQLATEVGVRSWQDLNRALFFALKLEKTLMFLSVFLIVIVAALALVSDIHLIVASKQNEIGILGAMGATRSTITRAFVLLGGGLGLAGIALGALVGVSTAWILGTYRLVRLPANVYFVDHVPFNLDPLDISVVLASGLLIAILAAALGARSAAGLRPVEVLHR